MRHFHATGLVNDGVSLATIRKRLSHKRIQPYCIGTSIELLPKDAYTILNISITDEDMMDWIEPDAKPARLLPLRDAISTSFGAQPGA